MYLNSLAQIHKLKGNKERKGTVIPFQLKRFRVVGVYLSTYLCLECLLDTLGQATCSMVINFFT